MNELLEDYISEQNNGNEIDVYASDFHTNFVIVNWSMLNGTHSGQTSINIWDLLAFLNKKRNNNVKK